MDPQIDSNWIGEALVVLLSWVLLPLGLLLWQIVDNTRGYSRGQKEMGQSIGCSCLAQFAAFVMAVVVVGNEMQAVGGAIYAIACSIASYFIMRMICKIPEQDARISAIWIAIVSIPAQIYAFGWVIGG